ncbi:hypothetical protein SteCoe_10385 [Stentor coeruleus]|uniref:RING-type domain-containing protein n=1 Tax=Stentor coeruleus TaxID=5963 RepID=A0A1R2CFM5_9CILI|nr:hypothetical protein SteCoe_10385 [Stentor coeruleus]
MNEDNPLEHKLQNSMLDSLENLHNEQGLSQTLNLEDFHDKQLTNEIGVVKYRSGFKDNELSHTQNFGNTNISEENFLERKNQKVNEMMVKSQIIVSSSKPGSMNIFPKVGPSPSMRFDSINIKHDIYEDEKIQDEKFEENSRKIAVPHFPIKAIPQNNRLGIGVRDFKDTDMVASPFVGCAPNPIQPRFKPETFEEEKNVVVVEREKGEIFDDKGCGVEGNNDKENEFMEIVFSVEHLSEIKDFMLPVVLNQDSSPNPNLYNFAIESLPHCNFHASQISSDHIISLFPHNQKLISSLIPHLSCPCGSSSSQKLPCDHIFCLSCCGSNINSLYCPKCKIPISCYNFTLKAYPCLSCKQIKTQRTSCIHYCYTCLNRKILRKGSYNCVLCPKFFDFNEFYEENMLIIRCKICQNECKDFFETCDGCFYCRDCFRKTLKDRKCGVCEREIGKKEFSKMRKMLKFVCQNCFSLKDWEFVVVQECCKGKLCKKCIEKVTKCLLCQ